VYDLILPYLTCFWFRGNFCIVSFNQGDGEASPFCVSACRLVSRDLEKIKNNDKGGR